MSTPVPLMNPAELVAEKAPGGCGFPSRVSLPTVIFPLKLMREPQDGLQCEAAREGAKENHSHPIATE